MLCQYCKKREVVLGQGENAAQRCKECESDRLSTLAKWKSICFKE